MTNRTYVLLVALLVAEACHREAARPPRVVPDPTIASTLRTVQVVRGRNGRTATRREDISVQTNEWEPVPTVIDSSTSGPWIVSPSARLVLAGDPSGSRGWLIDNAVLVEILDPSGQRLASALVGSNEPMVLDGEPIRQLGTASFRPGPTDVSAVFPADGMPFLLRVTALDYGGEAYATDVWLVVGPGRAPAETGGEAVAVPEQVEHQVVPGQEQVSPTCVGEARPIDQQRWQPVSARVVVEATTCVYRVSWNGWDPPRTAEYRPDGAGWISDYFISGSDQHGQVFWNVITGDVRVRPRSGQELTTEAAEGLAQHALATIFPGIDLDTLVFDPRPCPAESTCTPY
jgi:hypothetical protein